MKCFTCGGKLEEKKNLSFEIFRPGMVFIVTGLSGYVCSKCGEVSYDRKSVKKIDAEMERIENISPGYHRKLTKHRDEITLRLPKALRASMKLHGNEIVEISKLDKRKFVVSVAAQN